MNDITIPTGKHQYSNSNTFSARSLSKHARRVLYAMGMKTVRRWSPKADGGFTAYNGNTSVTVTRQDMEYSYVEHGDPMARVK